MATSETAPYVPDCEIVKIGDGTLLVTHLDSGRVRTAATDRQALIVGIALGVTYTWQQATLTPCPPTGHIGPIDVYPATATKKCRRCGQTWTWV